MGGCSSHHVYSVKLTHCKQNEKTETAFDDDEDKKWNKKWRTRNEIKLMQTTGNS